MVKLKINLFDLNGIIHSAFGGLMEHEYIDYITALNDFDGITIFTDRYLFNSVVDDVSSKIKIAWLYESKSILPNIYDVYKIQHKFDYIFTHDQSLLNMDNKYILVSPAGCWVPESSRKIHKKNKKVSFIFSDKKLTDEHTLRFNIYNRFKNELECFGQGALNFINTKDLALNDFMYSICIENCFTDNLFTEKIIDCFMTGTISIYCGCNNIGKFFNENGIIKFKSLDELEIILSNIDENKYNSMKAAIEENFNLAKEYCVIEDWIYKNILINPFYRIKERINA